MRRGGTGRDAEDEREPANVGELEETRKTRRSRRSDVPRGATAVRASKAAAATATTWWSEEAATAWSGVRVGGGSVRGVRQSEEVREEQHLSISRPRFILFDDSTGSRLGLGMGNRLDPLLID
jgi:hypothetical protein